RVATLDDLDEQVEAVVERAAEEVPAHEDRAQPELAGGGEALRQPRDELGAVDVVDVLAQVRVDRVLDDHAGEPGGRARLDVAGDGAGEADELALEAELGDSGATGGDLGGDGRHPDLDPRHAELGKRLRDRDPFVAAEDDARRLLAVAERDVVD